MNDLRKPSFIAFMAIAFMNAFVDLGHKIVIQNILFKLYEGQLQVILTAIINSLILLPFVLLFTPAGFISDRFAKREVIRFSALFAIVVTLLICACYYLGWFWHAFAMTLLLAVQSAVFSPAKYGYLREVVRAEKLAQANGILQSLTIVSILCSTFVFSFFFEMLVVDVLAAPNATPESVIRTLMPLGGLLVSLSVAEFLLSFKLPLVQSGDRTRELRMRPYFKGVYLLKNTRLIARQSAIILPIIGLCMFWSVSQVVVAAFPAYAEAMLNETNTVVVQGIMASTGIGVMIGALVAGFISRNHIALSLIPVGGLGIVIGLGLLTLVESRLGLVGVFLLLGWSGGFFMVPLNALIQYHAHASTLGTVIAGSNWIQNIAMIAGLMITVALSLQGASSREIFYLLAITAFAATVYILYRMPHCMARLLLTGLHPGTLSLGVNGFDNLPTHGAVMLSGQPASLRDWLLLQSATARHINLVVMENPLPIVSYLARLLGTSVKTPQQIDADFSLLTHVLNHEGVIVVPEKIRSKIAENIAGEIPQIRQVPFRMENTNPRSWRLSWSTHGTVQRSDSAQKRHTIYFDQQCRVSTPPYL
ncbi:Lysophospholipid transporter LplT [BD1-7 clade bacterium]|uniref:Lysophospholipid transporter LplT n=1 Tax=BD1-7 clade bacterium TaxID=2029982 RepID=A0A5S9QSH1_9GAMM|nr:Lysophospholipid transporter LplT [BD1-7 clade bacterium]